MNKFQYDNEVTKGKKYCVAFENKKSYCMY